AEGVQAAIAVIEYRGTRPGGLEYRLTSPSGVLLAGTLPIETPKQGWTFLDLPERASIRHGLDDVIVLTQRLRHGSTLSIGDDLDRGETVRIAVIQTLWWIGGTSAVLILLLGLWATNRSLGRMDGISLTLAAFAAGNLGARPRVRSPPRDDLDRVAL